MRNKKFKVSQIRDLLNSVYNEKITFSRFVEILNEPEKNQLVDYIYEFAALYGEYYHNKDADKILEKVSEKIELPEQFLQRTGFL
jgi:HEPN domain-containing protein